MRERMDGIKGGKLSEEKMEKKILLSATGGICPSGDKPASVSSGRYLYGRSGDIGADRPSTGICKRVCLMAADPRISRRKKYGRITI